MSFPSGENNVFYGNTVKSSVSLETSSINAKFSNATIAVGNPRKAAGMGVGNGGIVGIAPAYIKTNTVGTIGQWSNVRSLNSFSLLPGVNINASVYFGFGVKFVGLSMNITTAFSSGTIVSEYWNGSAWVSMLNMSTSVDSPYEQYADGAFKRVDNENIRFQLSMLNSWQRTTLNGGLSPYWMRFRVTSAISNSPVVSSPKAITSFYDMSSVGATQYFGLAEPLKQILFQYNAIDGATPTDPVSVDTDLTSTFSVTGRLNSFGVGVVGAVGAIITIPKGMDTSNNITVLLNWYPTTNASGDVNWQVEYVPVKVAADVNSGTLVSVTTEQATAVTPASLQILQGTSLTVTGETLLPGENLALRIFRDNTGADPNDTYAGDVTLFNVTIEGRFWM